MPDQNLVNNAAAQAATILPQASPREHLIGFDNYVDRVIKDRETIRSAQKAYDDKAQAGIEDYKPDVSGLFPEDLPAINELDNKRYTFSIQNLQKGINPKDVRNVDAYTQYRTLERDTEYGALTARESAKQYYDAQAEMIKHPDLYDVAATTERLARFRAMPLNERVKFKESLLAPKKESLLERATKYAAELNKEPDKIDTVKREFGQIVTTTTTGVSETRQIHAGMVFRRSDRTNYDLVAQEYSNLTPEAKQFYEKRALELSTPENVAAFGGAVTPEDIYAGAIMEPVFNMEVTRAGDFVPQKTGTTTAQPIVTISDRGGAKDLNNDPNNPGTNGFVKYSKGAFIQDTQTRTLVMGLTSDGFGAFVVPALTKKKSTDPWAKPAAQQVLPFTGQTPEVIVSEILWVEFDENKQPIYSKDPNKFVKGTYSVPYLMSKDPLGNLYFSPHSLNPINYGQSTQTIDNRVQNTPAPPIDPNSPLP